MAKRQKSKTLPVANGLAMSRDNDMELGPLFRGGPSKSNNRRVRCFMTSYKRPTAELNKKYPKTFLGDAVFIDITNDATFVLTTENEHEMVSNRVVLRFEVVQKMLRYFNSLTESKDVV